MKIEFSVWLKSELAQRGLTPSELARRAGMTTTTVYRVLNGERLPGAETCIKIAAAFNLPPQDVFRIAGILPKSLTDELENNLSFREIFNLMKGLSPEEQENLIAYAKFLLEQAKQK